MITQLAAIPALLFTFLSAQVEMNYSYELKYGDGTHVTPLTQDTTDYSYFENLLDINTYFGDNIYVYTQLEYSNPPVYGFNRTSIDSIINTFYIEFSYNRFNVKLGDLYELYGKGLSFYTLQDQTVDYDNSIKGFAINYFLRENLSVSTLVGAGKYTFRSDPVKRVTDYQFDTNAILGSIDYENPLVGYLQIYSQ